MKIMVFILVAALTLCGSSAFAENKHDVDVQLGAATPPADSTLTGGVAGGFGYTYHYSDNIGIRLDWINMSWSSTASTPESGMGGSSFSPAVTVKNTFTRDPIFLGGRYYLGDKKSLSFFGEAGYEVSNDKVIVKTTTAANPYVTGSPAKDTSVSASKDNSGLAAGVGLKYTGDNWFTGLSARYHAVTNPNSTVVLILGYSF